MKKIFKACVGKSDESSEEIGQAKLVRKSNKQLPEDLAALIRAVDSELEKEDNGAKIVSILQEHGFDKFTEDKKLFVLRDAKVGFMDSGLLDTIVTKDKISTLKAVLPFLPQFSVCNDEIPPDTECVGNKSTPISEMLLEEKARWNQDTVEVPKLTTKSTGKSEKMAMLSQMAGSLLAANLFSVSCTHNAVQCAVYLLNKAPALINVKVSKYANKLALHIALSEGCTEIIPLLLEKGATVGSVDRCKALEEIYKDFKPRIDLNSATRIMGQGHETALKDYRNELNESFIHILFHRFAVVRFCEVVEWNVAATCTEYLLSLGVDPTSQNRGQQTALDILIFGVRRITLKNQRIVEVASSMLQDVTGCVRLVLPFFKDGSECEYSVLLNIAIASKHIVQATLCVEYLKLFQVILDAGLFSVNEEGSYGHTPMQYLLSESALSCKKTMPCEICGAVVQLFCSAILQGLDVNREVNSLGACDSRYNSREPITYAGITTRKLVAHVARNGCYCIMDPVTNDVEVPCDCCYLTVFDLLIHCGANITSFILRDSGNAKGYLPMMLNSYVGKKQSPTRLALVYRIIQSICWFVPAAKPAIIQHFSNVSERLTDVDEIAAVQDLEEALQKTLPLKMISRMCITQNMEMKDVEKLPLPTLLKHYVLLGEYSLKYSVI